MSSLFPQKYNLVSLALQSMAEWVRSAAGLGDIARAAGISATKGSVSVFVGREVIAMMKRAKGATVTHHVHILEMSGESYRLKDSKGRRKPRS